MTIRRMLQIVSWLAVLCTIAPSICYLAGACSLQWMQWAMLGATVVWFAVTPWWMGRSSDQSVEESP